MPGVGSEGGPSPGWDRSRPGTPRFPGKEELGGVSEHPGSPGVLGFGFFLESEHLAHPSQGLGQTQPLWAGAETQQPVWDGVGILGCSGGPLQWLWGRRIVLAQFQRWF